MRDNSYEIIKHGVKNDIQGAAMGLVAAIGLLLLFITLFVGLLWFFYKENHYSTETKFIVSTCLTVFTLTIFINQRLGNYIYRAWLSLLLITVSLGMIVIVGWCLYMLLKEAFIDFI